MTVGMGGRRPTRPWPTGGNRAHEYAEEEDGRQRPTSVLFPIATVLVYDLDYVGAGLDWVEARIGRPPSDWTSHVRELDGFCPEIVDREVQDVEALPRALRRDRAVRCWWD